MHSKALASGIVMFLLLSTSFANLAAEEEIPIYENNWWDNYSRDKDHNGISDVLVWKLDQGDRFFNPGEARVFIRYDHQPTDYDVELLENAGVEVTYRAKYIDLLATTMPRDLISEISTWEGVVMLDDIGKAEPHMATAVPTMGVDNVWNDYGIYGEGISIAIVDTGVNNAHVGLDDFDDNGFTLIDSPIFTGNAVEGTTTLFEVDYFERSAYLTQSGQLYQEAGATAFGKTYCFGPCFRAEKSKTRRHLTEFWMVEPEMAFVDLDENMTWAENLVGFIIQRVLENCLMELETLERDISMLETIIPPFPRITYDEASKIILENGSDFKYGSDFGAPDETLLSEQFDKPIMIHRWPANIKPFYMKRDEHDHELALGVDMIAPEGYGEIIGGGQREDDIDILTNSIRHHDLPLEPFKWFLDLRKYGSVPHSGFGLGLERVVAWICGTKHIRETIPFPRTMTRLDP